MNLPYDQAASRFAWDAFDALARYHRVVYCDPALARDGCVVLFDSDGLARSPRPRARLELVRRGLAERGLVEVGFAHSSLVDDAWAMVARPGDWDSTPGEKRVAELGGSVRRAGELLFSAWRAVRGDDPPPTARQLRTARPAEVFFFPEGWPRPGR